MRMPDDYTLVLEHGEEVDRRTLYIFLTRGEKRIRHMLMSMYAPFERVVLNVDGEEHAYDADALIGLLERYEEVRG